MNVHELKEQDPKRFDTEYQEWAQHQCSDYDWWDSVEECFAEDMKPLGLEVDKIYFRLSYGQGDYASFTGYLNFAQWLEVNGYAEQYPALVIACDEYNANWRVDDRYEPPRIDWDYAHLIGTNTGPTGMFEGLDDATWCELIESQMEAEDWEKLINDWMRDKARDLYKSLMQEYEYLTSEEQFIESCESNEVEFTTEEE